MHILFLDAHAGVGADIAVHVSLARTLDRRQVRVTAATSIDEAYGTSAREAFASIPDLTLIPLNLGRQVGRERGFGRAVAAAHNLRGAASLVSLARWCRRNDVDVVHVTERPRQALFGLLLARLAGCACLIQAHISYYPHDATRLSNWRLRQANAVVGVSKFTAETYQRLAKLPSERVFSVHNAVDGTLFRPQQDDAAMMAMRQRLGIPANVPLIGCVARLMRWKGQETLLEAFVAVRRSIPDARLVLAGLPADSAPDGHGDYREYLIRRAHELGLANAVSLPGYLPQSDMPHFYAALDLVAHPSFAEPFGLAIVEAMACERAVVAVDGGGVPEIIHHGVDGWLVPPEDPAGLATAITSVLDDPSLRAGLAQSGRQRVLDAFTPEIQAAAMVGVYRRVVRRHRYAATLSRAPIQP